MFNENHDLWALFSKRNEKKKQHRKTKVKRKQEPLSCAVNGRNCSRKLWKIDPIKSNFARELEPAFDCRQKNDDEVNFIVPKPSIRWVQFCVNWVFWFNSKVMFAMIFFINIINDLSSTPRGRNSATLKGFDGSFYSKSFKFFKFY